MPHSSPTEGNKNSEIPEEDNRWSVDDSTVILVENTEGIGK